MNPQLRHFDIMALKRRRNRRLRGALYAAALITITSGFAFIDSWTERIAPNPDYYGIVLRELVDQHFIATNTTTVLKEVDETREFVEREFSRRNKLLRFPTSQIQDPGVGVSHFSYRRDAPSLQEWWEPVSQPARNPSVVLDAPVLALWVYSQRQGMLACFCYEVVSREILKQPPPTLNFDELQTIDRSGIVSVEGSFPSGGKFIPAHAFLLSLRNCKLENLDRKSSEDPVLDQLTQILPTMSSSAAIGMPPYAVARAELDSMRFEAALPFVMTRFVCLAVGFLAGLVWFSISVAVLKSLHNQYRAAVLAAAGKPAATVRVQTGFFRFLFGDVEVRFGQQVAELQAISFQEWKERTEEIELQSLKSELSSYRQRLELDDEQVVRLDEAMSAASIEELRPLAAKYRSLFERRQAELDREADRSRNTAREITRLETELEAIPPDKRHSDASQAWEMYQRARAAADSKEKLRLLKEARKKLPRELRPDRF